MDEPLVTDFDISLAVTQANALSVEFRFEASGPQRVTLDRDTARRLVAKLEEKLRTIAGSSPAMKL